MLLKSIGLYSYKLVKTNKFSAKISYKDTLSEGAGGLWLAKVHLGRTFQEPRSAISLTQAVSSGAVPVVKSVS